jgi:hypothetical protein
LSSSFPPSLTFRYSIYRIILDLASRFHSTLYYNSFIYPYVLFALFH